MPLTISLRFLTGRAHLHPWQAHHSDGRVDWPPSPWRLLRALVAAAGCGITTLPEPLSPTMDDAPGDDVPLSRLGALLAAIAAPPEIWLPRTSGGHTRQFFPIHEGGTVKNSGSAVFDTFAVVSKDTPVHFHWPAVALGQTQREDLAKILRRLTYFGRAESWVEATMSTALSAEVKEGHTHWRCVCTEDNGSPSGQREHADYTLERRLSAYWPLLPASTKGTLAQEAVHLFSDLRRPPEGVAGLESKEPFARFPFQSWHGRLELRAASQKKPMDEAASTTKMQKPWQLVALGDWSQAEFEACLGGASLEDASKKKLADLLKKRVKLTSEFDAWRKTLTDDANDGRVGLLLLRCLLRASGEDMKDGLERPIGTRWVHYAVPRAIYQLPSSRPAPRPRPSEPRITLFRFALNTATVNRAVLPPLTDTLLFADKFRGAALAWHGHLNSGEHPRNLCGREKNDHEERRVEGHDHAFFWPTDEDNDGFIDHVSVYCSHGFLASEVDALRRLIRIRQRGGRPDLLVAPIFIGDAADFGPWRRDATVFISATPYFCPVNLAHGRGTAEHHRGGKPRSVEDEIRRSLLLTDVIQSENEIGAIRELVFADASAEIPAMWKRAELLDARYRTAWLKPADDPILAGAITGLQVDQGTRMLRALSFCRRRRRHVIEGVGRMFQIEFATCRPSRPFSAGSQCHFGLGLFVPVASE